MPDLQRLGYIPTTTLARLAAGQMDLDDAVANPRVHQRRSLPLRGKYEWQGNLDDIRRDQ